MLEIFDTKG